MQPVGENTGELNPVWRHEPTVGRYCPIRTGGLAKYRLVEPISRDSLAGAEIRRSFFSRWQRHWGWALSIVDGPDVLGFVNFLKTVDRLGIWAQPGLEEWQLPYLYLAVSEFPPPLGGAANARKEWVRFRFDASIRSLVDLWASPRRRFTFLKLRYQAPTTSREPDSLDFIAAEPVEVDASWLTRDLPKPSALDESTMRDAFADDIQVAAERDLETVDL